MNRAYVRVSTVEQHEDRQVEALEKHGIDKWYIEKVSGKNANREQLQLMLAEAEPGDTIYIHDYSRLARSTKDLLDIVENLNSRDIRLVSTKDCFDTSTPTGKLMLTVIAGINEFERTNMLERQAEGVKIAKERGAFKNCGRKEKDVDQDFFRELNAKRIAGLITKTRMAMELGISRVTLDKRLKEVSLC